MERNKLFLLAPGFEDNGRREYCPECAEVWGVLSYFPAIRETLDILYMDIDKPRTPMVELFGENYQNCPTLLLSESAPLPEAVNIKQAGGHRFLDNARDIGLYFTAVYGTPYPRGS